MRKIRMILLCVLLIFSLSGCGQKGQEATQTKTSDEKIAETSEIRETLAETENSETDEDTEMKLYFSDIDNSLNLISKFKNFKFILNELNSVTSTRTIVEAIEALLLSNQVGIFNVANDGAYTIKQLSEAIGYKWSDEQVVDQHDLHKSQKLYLVNNVLDLSKLKQFYQPRDAIQEIKDLSNNLI